MSATNRRPSISHARDSREVRRTVVFLGGEINGQTIERIAKDARTSAVVCRRIVRPVWLPIVHSDRQKTRRTNARNNFVNALPLFHVARLRSPPLPPRCSRIFSLAHLHVASASFRLPRSFVNARNVIFLPTARLELPPLSLCRLTFGGKDNERQEIIFRQWWWLCGFMAPLYIAKWVITKGATSRAR